MPLHFFSLCLGGLIDWGHHANAGHKAISETVFMAEAVAKARNMTNSGQLLHAAGQPRAIHILLQYNYRTTTYLTLELWDP